MNSRSDYLSGNIALTLAHPQISITTIFTGSSIVISFVLCLLRVFFIGLLLLLVGLFFFFLVLLILVVDLAALLLVDELLVVLLLLGILLVLLVAEAAEHYEEQGQEHEKDHSVRRFIEICSVEASLLQVISAPPGEE